MTAHEILNIVQERGGATTKAIRNAGSRKWAAGKQLYRMRQQGLLVTSEPMGEETSKRKPLYEVDGHAYRKIYNITEIGMDRLAFYEKEGCTREKCKLCHGKRSRRQK